MNVPSYRAGVRSVGAVSHCAARLPHLPSLSRAQHGSNSSTRVGARQLFTSADIMWRRSQTGCVLFDRAQASVWQRSSSESKRFYRAVLSGPSAEPTKFEISSTRRPLAMSRLSRLSSQRGRTASTRAQWDGTYEAVVVGAGPAGVTVVGNLLEQRIEPILWVDNSFDGGRVNRCYREVPSNTRVGLFIDFATAVAPFRKIVSNTPSRSRWEEPSESDGVPVAAKRDKLQALRELDAGKGCYLGYAADMILMLTEGLRRTPGVHSQQARVSQAVLDEASSNWTVTVDDADRTLPDVRARRLILCTGSSPNNSPLPVDIHGLHTLDLDCALSPTSLSKTISPLGPTTVAVIGASHSAILVLMNLYNLASSTKPDLRIRWFTRHPLRYAEFMDGWILRDNTGLKGEAAVWAKANLEPETFDTSDVSKYIEKVAYEKGADKEVFEERLPGCDFHVQAIGYDRDPIPDLKTTDGKEVEPVYDHETGKFSYSIEGNARSEKDSKLPGMYGAGIAWPERVVDPHGNVEYAVGFWKFMKFVKKVVPEWQ